MKRILLIMPYGSVGGMERLALTFYKYYKQQGYHVNAIKLIKLENDIINFGEDELFFKSYDFSAMSKKERMSFYIQAPLLIRKIIKKHQITHSISFGDMANIFSSLTFTKDFKAGSIHALKSVELTNTSLLNRLLKFCFKTSFRKLDKLVCISKAIKKDIVENCGYTLANLELIYNPHDLHEIQKRSMEEMDTEEEKTLFNGKIILFLGRLSHQKSPWHLIKSFHAYRKNGGEAKLVFVGDGVEEVITYCNQLITKLEISDHVFFLGRKSNPYKYLKNADILALSSLYEGTPNVIVESISLGVPIVSSNCTDGIAELMSEEENPIISNKNVSVLSGIITPTFYKGDLSIPKDDSFIEEEQFFADALYQVMNDTSFKTVLIEEKERLLKKFDIGQVCEKYLVPIVPS